jgi:hypothetical protein
MGVTTGVRRVARRLRRPAAEATRAAGAEQPPKGACRVCHSTEVRRREVTHPKIGRTLAVRICQQCGFVGIPGNVRDYSQLTSVEQLSNAPRVGTEEVPGREYAMGQLGVEVLGRTDLSVLIYGAGRSVDNRHIAGLEGVSRVAIGDVFRAREDAEFVDVSRPASQPWDIVIAAEVIEHFVRPRAEFRRLFGYVTDDGLLVCSTNIYDGGALARQAYIYAPGHVAYYSPEALRRIAKEHGFGVDFRMPLTAPERAGRHNRKRYVLFSRSTEVMERVSDYFGRHTYAPSEWSDPRRTLDVTTRPDVEGRSAAEA